MKLIFFMLSCFAFVLLTAFRCTHLWPPTPIDKRLKIYNKTSYKIFWDSEFDYPDTLPASLNPSTLSSIEFLDSNSANIYYTLIPGDSTIVIPYPQSSTWEQVLDSQGILTMFIYEPSKVTDKTWQYIRDNKLYLRRYQLRLVDIEAINWKILYK